MKSNFTAFLFLVFGALAASSPAIAKKTCYRQPGSIVAKEFFPTYEEALSRCVPRATEAEKCTRGDKFVEWRYEIGGTQQTVGPDAGKWKCEITATDTGNKYTCS